MDATGGFQRSLGLLRARLVGERVRMRVSQSGKIHFVTIVLLAAITDTTVVFEM